jgi:activator of 2-hydroxyglutaryl-CoA dehydratase
MSEIFVNKNSILGIDIGSVSLSIVQIDRDGKILRKFYKFHKSNIHNAFSDASKIFDLTGIKAIACTSSSVCLNRILVLNYNPQVAIIAATKIMS